MRPLLASLLTLAVLVSTPGPALAAGSGLPPADVGGGPPHANAAAAARPDPSTDVVGWEGGYWYDDPIHVDQSDGLNESERRAYVNRTMARVEVVRDREFRRTVPVSVETRASFRERTSNDSAAPSYRAWNGQVWEASFVVGEDRDAQRVIDDTLGSSVVGYYDPATRSIRIIVPDGDRAAIDRGTLAHELTHALQDQYGGLNGSRPTQDGGLARDGLVEGEANYVEQLYQQRCDGEWACVEAPSADGGGGSGPANLGVLVTVLQPYSDGPPYVDWLRERGGWDAVDARYDDPPVSTEQTIHLTDERPAPLAFTDRARNGWETFPNQGVNGSDTLGEASIYAALWYQSRQHPQSDPVVDTGAFSDAQGSYDIYNYSAPPSAGWANDRLFPYRHNTSSGTDYGYVWVTAWDSPRDADQFASAYRAVLGYHDAERVGANVWVVRDGPFADAFAVRQNGTRVTVVNAPTVAALEDVRPGVAESDGAHTSTGSSTAGETTSDGAAGLGVRDALLGVVAVAAAIVVGRWRR